MSDSIKIQTLNDILALSTGQFERMLPDLIEWYRVIKPLYGVEGVDVDGHGFEWTDDGVNEITGVVLIDPKTQQRMEISITKGGAE